MKSVIASISLLVVLALGGLALPVAQAAAGEWQLAAGVADELDNDFAPAATLSYIVPTRFPIEIVGGYIGHRLLRSGRTESAWFLGADLRWSGRYWFVGGGGAWVNRESEILSSRYQFMTLAGLRWRDWVLTLRHLSNAGTGGRNRGETLLTLGWAW